MILCLLQISYENSILIFYHASLLQLSAIFQSLAAQVKMINQCEGHVNLSISTST